MKFGVFYELQLPRPWKADSELNLYQNALTQIDGYKLDHRRQYPDKTTLVAANFTARGTRRGTWHRRPGTLIGPWLLPSQQFGQPAKHPGCFCALDR